MIRLTCLSPRTTPACQRRHGRVLGRARTLTTARRLVVDTRRPPELIASRTAKRSVCRAGPKALTRWMRAQTTPLLLPPSRARSSWLWTPGLVGTSAPFKGRHSFGRVHMDMGGQSRC